MKKLRKMNLILITMLVLGFSLATLKAQTGGGEETTIELCPGSGETCAEGEMEVKGVKITMVKGKGQPGARVVIKK